MKKCSKCCQCKPLDEFNYQHAQCKSCYSEKRRDTRYLKRYNLSLDDYDSLYDEQGGKCAICETSDPGGRRSRFCVDHNHETDEVRGLLCYKCNSALGYFGDSPAVVMRGYKYLTAKGHYGE